MVYQCIDALTELRVRVVDVLLLLQVSLWQLDAADNLYHMRKQGHLGAQVIQVSWCGAVAVLLSSSGSVAVCDLLSLPAAASTREPAVDSSLAQPPAAPRQDSHAIIDSDSDDVVARAGRAPVRRRTMVMSDEDDDADAAPAREATSVVSSERSLGSKPRHAHKAKQSAATKADVSAYFDDAAAHSSESDASESGADSDTEPQVKVGTSTASAGTGSVVRVPALASAVIPSPAAPARNRSSSVASAADDVEHSSGDADAPVVAASVPAQDAFQPGSTARPDLTDAGTHRHFLVWNRVGSIVCRLDTDSDGVPMNNIDIEFADASRMRNIKFTEQFDFCMAALGTPRFRVAYDVLIFLYAWFVVVIPFQACPAPCLRTSACLRSVACGHCLRQRMLQRWRTSLLASQPRLCSVDLVVRCPQTGRSRCHWTRM